MIVVADTSPLNDLILIGHADLLRLLYGEVVIPRQSVMNSSTPSPLSKSEDGSKAPHHGS